MAKKQNTPTASSLPLVAIDLGSSGVRAMAAERVSGDMLRVLGYEENTRNADYMDRGVVTQSGSAGFMIGEVLRLLANRISFAGSLPTAFVCVGGRTMQIYPVFSKRDQCRKREVSQALLEDMERECRQKMEAKNPTVGVLGLVPSYYRLDGVEQDSAPTPEQKATVVEAHYVAFVGMKEMTTQLQKSFDQAGRSIEQSFVRPEVLLSAFAVQDGYETLQRGCGVLDFGAETMTLTLYKGGQYLFNKVYPHGSHHLTRAIEQQGIPYAVAEKLKCEYGFASPAEVDKNVRMRVPAAAELGGSLVVTSNELAELLADKLKEILQPVLSSLNEYADRIDTLYITGGGSMLAGLDHYLQCRTTVRVMYGAHAALLTRDTDDEYCAPRYSSLVGTLLMGADYRDQHVDAAVKKPNFVERVQGTVLDLFTDNNF